MFDDFEVVLGLVLQFEHQLKELVIKYSIDEVLTVNLLYDPIRTQEIVLEKLRYIIVLTKRKYLAVGVLVFLIVSMAF